MRLVTMEDAAAKVAIRASAKASANKSKSTKKVIPSKAKASSATSHKPVGRRGKTTVSSGVRKRS
jgi:hypothetical protein